MQLKPINKEIQRYLRTGKYDSEFYPWAGGSTFANGALGPAALREALIGEVRKRTPRATIPNRLAEIDAVGFTRAKVAPMVRGLFPKDEQDTILDVLGHSVVYLTPANIDTVLRGMSWLKTAWDLANLYLGSFGAELLSSRAPRLVGLSEETHCYVSADYFREENRFDDFVVHEVAHIFHNCKRRTFGLREIRGREWLLEIDFAKRETFAYACEAYSRLVMLGDGTSARKTLLTAHGEEFALSDDRVDADEYLDILREAVAARNGWKQILKRCAAPKATSPRLL